MASGFRTVIFGLLYLILSLGIPTVVIYTDYQNDISHDQDQIFLYEITLDPDNTSFLLDLGEFPEFTMFNVFMNRSSAVAAGTSEFYLLEEEILDEVVSGSFPDTTVGSLITDQPQFTGWINETIGNQGEVYLYATGTELNSTINLSGFYIFQVEGYLERNAFQIMFWTLLWFIVIIGAIPALRRYLLMRRFRKSQGRN